MNAYKASLLFQLKGFDSRIERTAKGETIFVSGNGWADFSISFEEGVATMFLETERGVLYAQCFHDDVERYLMAKPFKGELKDGTPLAAVICQHQHTGDEVFQINQREYLIRPIGLTQFLRLTEIQPGGAVTTTPLNQSA